METLEDEAEESERRVAERRGQWTPRENRIARLLVELESLRSDCDLAKRRQVGAKDELEVT